MTTMTTTRRKRRTRTARTGNHAILDLGEKNLVETMDALPPNARQLDAVCDIELRILAGILRDKRGTFSGDNETPDQQS